MNKLNKIFAILILSVSTSCAGFLSEEPVSELTKDKYWKTAKDAEVGVTSIYNAFTKSLGAGLWDWGELKGDNFVAFDRGAEDQREIINNTVPQDNAACLWTDLYKTISLSNFALKYIPNISMPAEQKTQLLAEARTMRAWAYFYCVRVWGDVPVYTEPIEGLKDDLYRRRTVKGRIINDIIIGDLQIAESMINKTATRNRVNVMLVYALMMDVYAWVNNYDMVEKIMKEKVLIQNASNWGLEPMGTAAEFNSKWRNLFFEKTADNVISKEIIFKLDYFQPETGVNAAIQYFASPSPKLLVSNELIASYTSSDLRKSLQWNGNAEKIVLKKKFWVDGTNFDTGTTLKSDVDLVLYRYADVVLLYAEALCKLDKYPSAIEELNKTRVRAGLRAYSSADFVDGEELLAAILNERRLEFVGEGKRWFDLVRTKSYKDVGNTNHNNPESVYFPIHRDHIIQNPNLLKPSI